MGFPTFGQIEALRKYGVKPSTSREECSRMLQYIRYWPRFYPSARMKHARTLRELEDKYLMKSVKLRGNPRGRQGIVMAIVPRRIKFYGTTFRARILWIVGGDTYEDLDDIKLCFPEGA